MDNRWSADDIVLKSIDHYQVIFNVNLGGSVIVSENISQISNMSILILRASVAFTIGIEVLSCGLTPFQLVS